MYFVATENMIILGAASDKEAHTYFVTSCIADSQQLVGLYLNTKVKNDLLLKSSRNIYIYILMGLNFLLHCNIS